MINLISKWINKIYKKKLEKNMKPLKKKVLLNSNGRLELFNNVHIESLNE